MKRVVIAACILFAGQVCALPVFGFDKEQAKYLIYEDKVADNISNFYYLMKDGSVEKTAEYHKSIEDMRCFGQKHPRWAKCFKSPVKVSVSTLAGLLQVAIAIISLGVF